MANSVDNRVVQMEFENDSFEKGVAESLRSLENLHKSLGKGIDAKGLDNFSNKVASINFASVGDQIDSVENRCNGLVSILKATVSELGGWSGVLTKSIGASAIGQIISGGSTRASNIEQAKFQLKGLGVAWEEVSGSLDHAVKDTAYGLDEAAKAASQYIASGVKLGDEMNYSLRAISGVAAMTNSSFEETAQIFTTVAGNGRLFASELNRLGARGLNAAAILAERFNVTEQELRDMVSKGQVDFKTFAKAMDDAFGEHAKEANSTFTGAFANMKASLSRIGADFIMPIHEMERQVFLGVKDMINNVRSGLNSMVDVTRDGIFSKEGIESFGDRFVEAMEIDGPQYASIVSSFEKFAVRFGSDVQGAFDRITQSGVLKQFVESFTWPITGLMELLFGLSTAFTDIFSSMIVNFPVDAIKNLIDPIGTIAVSLSNFLFPLLENIPAIVGNVERSLGNLINAGLTVLQPLLLGVFEGLVGPVESIFDLFNGGLKTLANLTLQFDYFTKNLGLTSEQANILRESVSGFFSSIRGIGESVLSSFGSILSNVLKSLSDLAPLFNSIVNLIGAVAGPVFSLAGQAIEKLAKGLSDILRIDFGDKGFLGMSAEDIKGVANSVNNIAQSIRDGFSDVTLDNVIEKIRDFTNGFIDLEAISSTIADAMDRVYSRISEAFRRIKDLLSGKTSLDDTLFGSIANGIRSAFSIIGGAVDSLEGVLQKGSDIIVSIFSAIVNTVTGCVSSLMDAIISLDFSKIISILSVSFNAFLAGTFVKFIYDLAQIPKTLNGIVKSIVSPFESFAGMLDSVSGAIESFAKTASTKVKIDSVRNIAIAIGILSASLFMLSLIPMDRIATTLSLFAVAVAAMVGIMVAVDIMFKSMAKTLATLDPKAIARLSSAIAAMAALMMSIAISIGILAAAIGLLSLVNIEKALPYLVAIGVFIAEFAAIAAIVGHSKNLGSQILQMAAMIVSMAVAIGVLSASLALLSVIPFDRLVGSVIALSACFIGLAAAIRIMSSAANASVIGSLLAASVFVAAMSVALIALASALKLVSTIPDVGPALISLMSMMAIMALLGSYMSSMSEQFGGANVLAASAGMLVMASAVLVLSAALRVMSSVEFPSLIGAVVGLAAAMAVLVVAGTMLSAVAVEFAIASVGILVMSAAIMVLAGALGVLSSINFFSLLGGIIGLAAAMAVIVIAAGALSAVFFEIIPASVGLLIMAAAILVLANALGVLASVDFLSLLGGIVGLAAAMTVIVAAALFLSAVAVPFTLASVGMILMSVAIIALAGALSILASISFPSLMGAVLGFALAMAVLVAASIALSFVSAGLITLGAAILIAGVGFLAFGLGLSQAATALLMFSTITPTAAKTIAENMATLATGIGNSMVIMAEKTAEAFVKFGQTLSQSSGQIQQSTAQIGKSAALGFGEAAPQFGMAGVNAILSFVQGLGSQAAAIASAGALLLANLLVGIANGIGAVIDAAAQIGIMFVSGIADSMRSNAEMMGEALSNLMHTLMGLFENLLANLAEELFGNNPMTDALRASAEEQLAIAEESSAKVSEAFASKNDEMLSNQESVMGSMADVTSEGGDQMVESVEGVGENVAETLRSSMESGIAGLDLTSAFEGSVDFGAISSQFGSGANDAISQYTTGVQSGLDGAGIPNMFQAKSEEAVQAAASVDSSSAGSEVGSNFGSGMASGIDAMVSSVAASAAAMVTAAKEAANAAMGAASPSKDMMKSGGYFGEGFYIGMGLWMSAITNRSKEMVSSAKRPFDGIKAGMNRIFDNVDFDYSPTITPVLDLSDVRSGLRGMDSMFAAEQAVRFGRLNTPVESPYGGYYNNVENTYYDLSLNWEAGQDANMALNNLSNALKARNMTGGSANGRRRNPRRG